MFLGFLKPGGSVSTENKERIREALGISGAMLSTVQRPLNLAERKGHAGLSGAALWDEGELGSQAGCSHKHRWTLAYVHTMSVSLHVMQLRKSETITPTHCHEKAAERKQQWELGI